MKITHVNPNCLDSRFCLPHGEEGKVDYDIQKLLSHIKQLEDKEYKCEGCGTPISKYCYQCGRT